VATNAVWDDMYGGVDFRGKEFKYDPLNLAESYKPFLPWFREAEIKHGRTAMLAVMGFIATDFVRIPGDMYSFEAIPKTIDAHDALLKTGPMYQLLFWVGFIDLLVTAPGVVATYEGEREPGGELWDVDIDADYIHRLCCFCDVLRYFSQMSKVKFEEEFLCNICMNYGTNFISFSFTKTVSYLQTSPLALNLLPRTMPVCKRRRLPSSSTDALP
jgi:hypothetical protein